MANSGGGGFSIEDGGWVCEGDSSVFSRAMRIRTKLKTFMFMS